MAQSLTNRNRLLEKYVQVVREDGLNTNKNVNIGINGNTSNLWVGGNVTVGGTVTSTGGLAPLTLAAAAGANYVPLTVSQVDTTNNPDGLDITGTSTGNLLSITDTSAAGGNSLKITHGATGSGGSNAVQILGTSSRSPGSASHFVYIADSVASAAIAAVAIADSNTNSNWSTLNVTSVRTGQLAAFTHNVAVNSGVPDLTLNGTQTITGGVTDGYHASIKLTPTYSAATSQTVTRHNYFDVNNVTLSGAGPAVLTNGALFRFNAAIGTHVATTAGTTKTSPGTVSGWVNINVNGTLYYIPAYTSTTS